VFSRAEFGVGGSEGTKSRLAEEDGRGNNNIIQEDSKLKSEPIPRNEEKEDEQLNVALEQFGEGIRS
jgi:hypothetical protein